MAQTELTQQLTRALGFDLSKEEVDTVAEELERMREARRKGRPDEALISLEGAVKRAGSVDPTPQESVQIRLQLTVGLLLDSKVSGTLLPATLRRGWSVMPSFVSIS